MSGSRVDGDDVVGVSRKGTLEESIIWFVPDNPQLGERIANTTASDDFSKKPGSSPSTSPYSSRMAGLAQASINPDRTSSKTSAERFSGVAHAPSRAGLGAPAETDFYIFHRFNNSTLQQITRR